MFLILLFLREWLNKNHFLNSLNFFLYFIDQTKNRRQHGYYNCCSCIDSNYSFLMDILKHNILNSIDILKLYLYNW